VLNRQIGRLLAFENAVDVAGRAPLLVNFIRSVGDQAAIGDKKAHGVDRWQLVLGRERDDQLPTTKRRRAGGYNQTAARFTRESGDGLLYPAVITRINRRQLHPE